MNSRMNTVITALETIAEETDDDGRYYKVSTINRWLASLPGDLEKRSHLVLEDNLEPFNALMECDRFLEN